MRPFTFLLKDKYFWSPRSTRRCSD